MELYIKILIKKKWIYKNNIMNFNYLSPELLNHILYPIEYSFSDSMFKSSDIFSFGLILIKSINDLKDKDIYDMNIINKGKALIKY